MLGLPAGLAHETTMLLPGPATAVSFRTGPSRAGFLVVVPPPAGFEVVLGGAVGPPSVVVVVAGDVPPLGGLPVFVGGAGVTVPVPLRAAVSCPTLVVRRSVPVFAPAE